ncbi:HEPN domain-containing protein [Candidatus Poribacteria bacterium]|nr:HEPN domain-containing protein [Candidatus Poribacteria bacterium]
MDRSQDWINEAEGDLEHARKASDGGFQNWACFSAQQSAEKAVKAVFQKMGVVAWGHSVSDLLKELSKSHQVSNDLINRALELDKSYISARYPDAHPSGSPRDRFTIDEARRLINYAEQIFRFCSVLLSSI